jgi:hypothetical protein
MPGSTKIVVPLFPSLDAEAMTARHVYLYLDEQMHRGADGREAALAVATGLRAWILEQNDEMDPKVVEALTGWTGGMPTIHDVVVHRVQEQHRTGVSKDDVFLTVEDIVYAALRGELGEDEAPEEQTSSD